VSRPRSELLAVRHERLNDPAGAAVELLSEPVKRLVADRAFVA
jgi:hypothetical protein